MRKVILTAALLILAAGICNAQWYVGGGFILRLNDAKKGDMVQTNNSSFSIAPRVGYVFNKKVLAGLEVGYGTEKSLSIITDLTAVMNQVTVAPYIRYNFLAMGRFAIGAEASFGYTNIKVKGSKDKAYALGVGLTPVVTLGITEHLWLETSLTLFGLNYEYSEQEMGFEDPMRTNTLSFGFNGDSLFTLGDIKFGIVYRF